MKSVHSINSLYFIAGLAIIIVGVNISKLILYDVPELRDSDVPFIGSQSWKDLRVLNDFGPKVVGTHENEVLAVNFLKKRITEIQSKVHQNQNVTLDHQIVSGSYFLGFKPYGMVAAYRNIQNILVKLDGESTNSLMLNCHFDTVPGSPGAADDGANCVIMLELLKILSESPTRNRHTIIFCFNGAEEIGLKASHGFITQHKWAKDIKAFINLEAAGSGGKEVLFQTGPGHSWLLNHYQKVNRPFAQAAGEEIFQSGLIPSDTDFRIFRDFGKIPGLDFAHSAKGYRYHTKYDSIDFLTPGVLQRTGENMLNLVISMANSIELDDITKYSKDSTSVYFDFLGLFFIHYTKEVGVVVNFIVVILSIVVPFLTLTKATVNVHQKRVLSETLLGFISIICGTGFSGLVCYLTAFGMDQIDHSMSWYRNTFLASGIYGSAALLSQIFVYDIIELTLGNKKSPISLGLKVQSQLNGINVFWGVITLGVTLLGFRVGYLFMVMLLITLTMNLIICVTGLHNSVHSWLYIYLIGQFFIVLWTSYLFVFTIHLFIPITGRSGSARNPDALISVLSCLWVVYMCSYFIPLTQLLRKSTTKYLTLITICLVSVLLAVSSSYGFPYQGESSGNPAIQRHYVTHTTRTFFDEHGAVRKSDAGYYFMQWDRHGRKTIDGVSIPDLPLPVSEMCNNEILCGLPLINSRLLLLGGQWLPSSTPKFPDIAIIDSHSKIILADNKVKYSFTINGTSLSGLYMRPRENVELVSWSLTEEVPETFNRTYFVSIHYGIETEPFNFDVTLKTDGSSNVPLLDMNVISIRFDRKKDYTNDFKKILNRFPKWAFAIDCISGVTGYTF